METVVVARDDAPLVPLALVKQHLRLDDDDTSQDLVLATMIDTAAALIDGPDGWLGRALRRQVLELRAPRFPCAERRCGSAALVEFQYGFAALACDLEGDYCGYGSNLALAAGKVVLLACPPIAAVEAIVYRDTTGAYQTLDPAAYQAFGRAILPVFGTDWPLTRDGPGAVAIRYAAGYGMDGDGSAGRTDPLPAVVRSALLLMIGSLYEGREANQVELYGTAVERLLQPVRLYV